MPLERYIIAFYFRRYKMKDKEKTKKQLIDELTKLRQRITELEELEANHRRTEEVLRDSEERHRKLFEEAQDGIFLADAETGVIIDCNRAAAELVGRDKSELIGQHQKILHPPQKIKEGFSLSFKKHIDESEGQVLEEQVITRTGKIKEVAIKANILHLGGRKLLQGIFHDITERKRAEEALRENEEKYYGLFDNSTEFIYILDSKGTFVEVNRAAEVLTGYSKSKLIGMNFKDYVPPEYHKRVFNAFYNVFTTGKQLQDFPLEVIVKDGTKKYFEINVGPLRKGEQIIGFHGCSRDITERKQAEDALQESEEKYRTILDNIEEGFYEVDLAGNFTFFNDSLCRMLNYSKDELMGMNNQQYMDKESAKRVYEIFNKVYKTGRPSKGIEFQTIRKDRVKKHGEISVSLIKDSKGQPIGFRGIIRDITERKLAEEKIKASLEEKEVMLREIHHRVKNNMQIMSSLLRLQSGKIKDKKTLEIFKTSQSRIRSMAFIHESLYNSKDLARIDFSDYTSRVTTHLFSLYGARKAPINYKVEVKDVFLDINTAIPCGLIINELVTNSLKHAFPDDRRGEILVKMHADKRGKHTLIVKDTGIGFPEELDFRETETLGMQLVTDLVIQIGRSIKLNREGGTTFTIVF